MDRKQLDDLWIGDWITVTLTGVKGKFEGIKGDHAMVNINGQKQLVEAKFLELSEDPGEDQSLSDLLGLEIEKPEKIKTPISSILDLHLEKLPGYSAESGQTILDFQLKTCRSFIEEIIQRKMGSAIIIHGKGEGILKEQVIHLLGDFPQVKHHFPRNHGGALEILLYY